MFDYTDPVGTGALQRAGALPTYRAALHGEYRRFGRRPGSGFTLPEAFLEIGNLLSNCFLSKKAFHWSSSIAAYLRGPR